MKLRNIHQKSNLNIFKLAIALLLVLFVSCSKKTDMEEIFKNAYYSDFNKSQMNIFFKNKNDTIYFSYEYAIDNGSFLNASDDVQNDFAGYFLKKDIIENKISFKIKNFRYSSDSDKEIYNKIKLHFISNDEIVWDTDLTNEKNNFVPYLPNTVMLRIDMQTKSGH